MHAPRVAHQILRCAQDDVLGGAARAYSCLSASIGLRRAARSAGYVPKISPTPNAAIAITRIVDGEKPGVTEAAVIRFIIVVATAAATAPRPVPTRLPAVATVTDSARNCV